MFYVNTRRKGQVVKEKEVLDAMLVPPEERLSKDQQVLFRFFADEPMLKELQRTKSLNARIKCIAALQLLSKEDFVNDEHVLLHIFEDQRIIVLPKVAKKEAESYNEKLVRRKMDMLSAFSMVRELHYDQLLFLAYHMEEDTCKYKDYLYRQGEEPQHVFFIVEGEFHYVKDCREGVRQKAKKGKKLAKLRSLEEEEDEPNKSVKPQMARYRVGIVQGKLGQSVGLEEIVLWEKKRRYSVLCNSTQSKIIRIQKEHLQTIFQEFPEYRSQLCNQVNDANAAKMELFLKIKDTKLNLQQYLRKSQEKLQAIAEHGESPEMRTLESNKEEESRYRLPVVQKKSSFSIEFKQKFRANSSALSGSILEQSHIKSLKSQSHVDETPPKERYEQAQGAFALTSLKDESNRKSIKSLASNTSKQKEPTKTPDLFLPLIGKKSVADLDGFSINLQPHRGRARGQTFGGMVDCSKLVQEKESILERKSTKMTRDQIFPFGHIEYKHPKRAILEDPMKLKASPAHSNRFMEKMLLKVLKKAGYDQAAKEYTSNGSVGLKTPVPHPDFHRSLSKHKKKERAGKEQLLVDSAFDDCYFSKL